MTSISVFDATCTADKGKEKLKNSWSSTIDRPQTHLEYILCNCWTLSVTDWLSFVVAGNCSSAHRRFHQPFDRPSPNFVKSNWTREKEEEMRFKFVCLHSNSRFFCAISSAYSRNWDNREQFKQIVLALRFFNRAMWANRRGSALNKLLGRRVWFTSCLRRFAYKLINAMSRKELCPKMVRSCAMLSKILCVFGSTKLFMFLRPLVSLTAKFSCPRLTIHVAEPRDKSSLPQTTSLCNEFSHLDILIAKSKWFFCLLAFDRPQTTFFFLPSTLLNHNDNSILLPRREKKRKSH